MPPLKRIKYSEIIVRNRGVTKRWAGHVHDWQKIGKVHEGTRVDECRSCRRQSTVRLPDGSRSLP